MIKYDNINFKNVAIYINFPFCKIPCSYCHYIDNISFGYNSIPNDYVDLVIAQLENVFSKNKKIHLESIYFGGGTPSLLNDYQCRKIESVFKKYNITSNEISIEIYPGMCNFDYIKNTFFTRYSIGVQSFDKNKIKKYKRLGYTAKDILSIIENIRKSNTKKVINIDLIFDYELSDLEIDYINIIKPETVTFYPNTKKRGEERLIRILQMLNKIDKKIIGYHTLGKNKFIYIKNDSHQSFYSKLEYETYGDIIGIGHCSISNIGKKSYLCIYKEKNIIIKERIHIYDRILNMIMFGIYSGVRKKYILKYFFNLYNEHLFFTVADSLDISDTTRDIDNEELVYLPESEYIKFYSHIKKSFNETAVKIFLNSIGFGDSNIDVINSVYNKKNLLSNKVLKKIKAPNIYILIEGIDGSGKDTFARIFAKELKKRFFYSDTSRISITGEPNSKLKYGIEAKKFIENIEYSGGYIDVKNILSKNRYISEKSIKNTPGIVILVRGFVTDKATFYKIFNRNENLGEGHIIKNWYAYIVIDISPEIADRRIEARGIPRTWREKVEYLKYFRDYYINYENKLFEQKIIINNFDINVLNSKAIEIANEIYINANK